MQIRGVPIIHISPRCVVVDKPAGLLSVPGRGEANRDCVVARVREAFAAAAGPLVVHRLDMDTSGLMVLGLDVDAQRELSRQFESREVEKAYTALVEGMIAAEQGSIDAPLRADIENRPMQVVDAAAGRPALTDWRLLGLEHGRSRLELRPVTGRTHQLRVHAAHIGHPIVGDVLYGREERGAERLMLHAALLAFTEPGGGRVEFVSAAPF